MKIQTEKMELSTISETLHMKKCQYRITVEKKNPSSYYENMYPLVMEFVEEETKTNNVIIQRWPEDSLISKIGGRMSFYTPLLCIYIL